MPGTAAGKPAGMPRRRPPQGLTALQVEVGRIFFGLRASEGFLVSGDAALAALRLTDRRTRDLRLVRFEEPPDHLPDHLPDDLPEVAADPATAGAQAVLAARDALHAEVRGQGWVAQDLPDAEGAALLVEGGGRRLVVTFVSVPAELRPRTARPATLTVLGPTRPPEDLAGELVAALCDGAQPDALVDVHAVSRRFPTAELEALAAEADLGFDPAALARALAGAARLPDAELPVGPDRLAGLRRFALDWSAGLAG
jgi:hypothetical protein